MKFTPIAKKLHKAIDIQLTKDLKNYADEDEQDMRDMFTQDADDGHTAADFINAGDMASFHNKVGYMDTAAGETVGYLLAPLVTDAFWLEHMENGPANWSPRQQMI